MSNKNLQQGLDPERLDALLNSPMGKRAQIMGDAYNDELIKWEKGKRILEEDMSSYYEFFEWVKIETSYTLDEINKIKQKSSKQKVKNYILHMFGQKTKEEKEIIKLENYLQNLVNRSFEAMEELEDLNYKANQLDNDKPNVALYELGVLGESLFKPV